MLHMVQAQLSASTYKRKAILLEGVSNSGKTVILTKLALRINKELPKNPAVVFFVSGVSESEEWKANLSYIIKEFILKKQLNDDQIINRVVLICDDISEDISVIQNYFQEDNVLVVGSGYLHTNTKYDVEIVPVDSKLDDIEKLAFVSILSKFDDRGYANLSNRKSRNYNCIFEVLSSYARYKHSRLWLNVDEHISGKLKAEGEFTEDAAGLTFFEETQTEILKSGIGAAVIAALGDAQNLDFYVEKIKLINRVLATSGQFGKKLPFDIVLKIIQAPSDSLNIKVSFFKKLLLLDSMVEFELDENTGKYYVKFRNPSEAYGYLKLNYPEKGKRHECEMNSLCKIIKACNWYEDYSEETFAVIDLVRCFGSNSFGRPFEEENNVAYEYKEFWMGISDSLKEADALKNGEALIVYCHFLRESLQRTDNKDDVSLFEAYCSLTEYIQTHGDSALGIGRKYRICGEICSNLNAMMVKYNGRSCDEVFLNEFKAFFGDFEKAFSQFEYYFREMNKFANKDRKGEFDTNFQLDIWLNAVDNFKKNGLKSDETEKKYNDLMTLSMENSLRLTRTIPKFIWT